MGARARAGVISFPYDDTEPYRSIEKTMRRFTFTVPVEQSDLDYVAGALRSVAPGCAIDVSLWSPFVHVRVTAVDGPVFTRAYVAIQR